FWFSKRVSETNIGQPTILHRHQQSHVIKLWSETTILSRDSCRKHARLEAQAREERCKGSVEFVAKTSTFVSDDLLVERIVTENYRSSKVNVKILKRY